MLRNPARTQSPKTLAVILNRTETYKMKKKFFTIPLFLIGITLFGQTLTINKATLDRKILSQDSDGVSVRGIIEIEYEIKNNTKDTIHLFTRLVEPFLEEKPFQIIQTQNSIEKFAKECGGKICL